ncbi:MAG: thioredoxin [Micromonosporaceae bacterium]
MRADDPRMAAASFARGAVDLSALNARTTAPSNPQPAAGNRASDANGGVTIIDVTEATFQSEVLERSLTTPVVVDFWAEWCGPCKQLSPVLEKLAVEGGGSWVLAKVDTEANPRIAAAFQIQSIPTVYAVIGGQPVDAFMGVIPESQLRQWIDALLKAAEQSGLSGDTPDQGNAGEDGQQAPASEPPDPAEEALASGDFQRAEEIYQKALSDNPADAMAAAGLAQARLLRRTEQLDPDKVFAAAAENPDDLEAQTQAADIEVLTGNAATGYARLVDLVRRTAGDDRGRARDHLVSLFAIAEPDDPAVAAARRDLANALF